MSSLLPAAGAAGAPTVEPPIAAAGTPATRATEANGLGTVAGAETRATEANGVEEVLEAELALTSRLGRLAL